MGRTALGVTDEMLTWQTERLQQLADDRGGSEASGVVTVSPEQVVEVTFESVHEARPGSQEVSLRSARVRRYRDDKLAADCDTIETVRSLVQVDERDESRQVGDAAGLRRRRRGRTRPSVRRRAAPTTCAASGARRSAGRGGEAHP